MVRLTRMENGSWRARKRLPDDVRDEYGSLYGPRTEALFYAPRGTEPLKAKQLFGEWLAEVEGRVAAIRAQHKGEGISLTPRQTRALAGEWYAWFTMRNPFGETETWERLRDRVGDALEETAGAEWHEDPRLRDDLWRSDEGLRKAVRSVIADVGETAQFLHSRKLLLDSDTRDRFLDDLYFDLAAALKRLIRQSQGD